VERKKKSKLSLIAIAVALFFVFLIFRSATIESVYPMARFNKVFQRHVISRITGFFKTSAVYQENKRLKQEVSSLAILVDEVSRLEAENNRLRSLVGYKEKQKSRFIACTVLCKAGGVVERSNVLIVDKGAKAGIRKNAIAIVPEGLVGKVIAVTSNTAEILLITDPKLQVSCSIQYNGGEVLGVLSGGSFDCLSIKRLMGNLNMITPGAIVKTTGLGGVFPAGFAVGDYLGDGCVRPRVDFSSLEDIFVRYEE
jgi:rod shape-determining protein MreC